MASTTYGLKGIEKMLNVRYTNHGIWISFELLL